MRKILVVDLDGTLCDCGHREHWARAGEWDSFHSELSGDKPNEAVREVLYAWDAMGQDHEVIAITGRNERYSLMTEEWLEENLIPLDVILMRPDNNFQSDHELKPALLSEWLEREGLLQENVAFILEDRDKVVEAWRNCGYKCWQVAPGGY